MTKIWVQGFKSFRDRVEVDFKPLTLLAGANSSGKTSLIQPLLLLKQTFEAPFDPGFLLLDGPNVSFSEVKQLFWWASGEKRAKKFTIGFELESGEHGLELTFERTGEKRNLESLHTTEWTWILNGERYPIRPGMSKEELPEGFRTLFQIKDRIPEKTEVLSYRSFLLTGISSILGLPVEFLASILTPIAFLLGIIHVPGLRGNPSRTYRLAATDRFSGVFQDYVASIIASWQKRSSRQLQLLSEDLRRLGLTWKIEAVQVNAIELELKVGRLPESRRGGARDTVNIADVGFGVSQVLPVLVGLRAAEQGQLVFLEQPELHLHPRAQVEMAWIIADAVKRGVQVVVETHSELILLGIQRLVAEGVLPAKEVQLLWFTRDEEGVTRVRGAEMDEDGSFGDWPVDFAEVSLKAQKDYLDAVTKRAWG